VSGLGARWHTPIEGIERQRPHLRAGRDRQVPAAGLGRAGAQAALVAVLMGVRPLRRGVRRRALPSLRLEVANIAPVGKATLGAALYGQLDLAENVWQWNLDSYATT
jgi:hypothetical protein